MEPQCSLLHEGIGTRRCHINVQALFLVQRDVSRMALCKVVAAHSCQAVAVLEDQRHRVAGIVVAAEEAVAVKDEAFEHNKFQLQSWPRTP